MRRGRRSPGTVAVAAGALVLAISGCAFGGGDGDDPPPAPPSASGALDAGGEGAIVAYPDRALGRITVYARPDSLPADLLSRFEADTNISAVTADYGSAEEMAAAVSAGETPYDVVVVPEYLVTLMTDNGLLARIDVTAFPNGTGLEDSLVEVPYDPGRMFTAPYVEGTTGIGYDSTGTGTAIASWADYFAADSPAAGRIGSLGDVHEVVAAALRAAGAQPCSEDPADYEKALTLLQAWRPQVAAIDSTGVVKRVSTGRTTVQMMRSSDFHRAAANQPSLQWVAPAEGTTLWHDTWAVPVNAKNAEAGVVFINWMLDPRNAADAADAVGARATLPTAAEQQDAAVRNDPVVNPPAQQAGTAMPECSLDALDLYDQVWTAFDPEAAQRGTGIRPDDSELPTLPGGTGAE